VQTTGQLVTVPLRLLTYPALTAKTRFVGRSNECGHPLVKIVDTPTPNDDVHTNSKQRAPTRDEDFALTKSFERTTASRRSSKPGGLGRRVVATSSVHGSCRHPMSAHTRHHVHVHRQIELRVKALNLFEESPICWRCTEITNAHDPGQSKRITYVAPLFEQR
jgi:hypothetical protein